MRTAKTTKPVSLAWLFAVLLALIPNIPRECQASILRQVPYSQGGYVVGKLTRSFTRAQLDRDIFGALGGVATHAYPDPDTQHRVDIIAVADPKWNRIVWSTSYEGETSVSDFGVYGSGTAQMDSPSDLAFGSNGNLFVADTGNNRIIVFTWTADCTCPVERFFGWMFTIQGGTSFDHPDQVLWDDNGTPADGHDDIVWVLDSLGAKIAGYHITYTGSGPNYWIYSPYVAIDLNQAFPGASLRYPTSFAKGRGNTSASTTSTYCTEELVVFDAANHCFLKLGVPRTSGAISSPATQITVSTVPNPVPGLVYTKLATDAWGNILGLDGSKGNITKFSSSLQVVGTYGSFGTGGLGTQQMCLPKSLAFGVDHIAGVANYSLGKQVLLGELWSDNTGIQALEPTLELSSPTVLLEPSTMNAKVGVQVTDNGRLQLRILDEQTGATIRTLVDQVVSAGLSEFTWDGRNDAGSLASQCIRYKVEARVTGLYAALDTVLASTVFYYKPKMMSELRLTSNVPAAAASVNGQEVVLTGTIALPCSACVLQNLSVVPQQIVGGSKYCFDAWSDGGFRSHSVQIQNAPSVTLNLVPSGSGPTNYLANATLKPDLSDCRSPHIFAGNATAPNGLLVYPGAKLRFRAPTGPAVPCTLKVYGAITATDAVFETTDSVSNTKLTEWSGIRQTNPAGGSVNLKGCTIRNASVAVGLATGIPRGSYLTASIDSCLFEKNAADVLIEFNHVNSLSSRSLHLANNYFSAKWAVKVTGADTRYYPSEISVPAAVDSNVFAAASSGTVQLDLWGGFTGHINKNIVSLVGSNSTGFNLASFGDAYPNVSMTQNSFVASSGRNAVVAPILTVYRVLSAIYNSWGTYTSESIENLIVHKNEAVTAPALRAEVIFEPYNTAGGGSGIGCPFVLSERANGEYILENSILGLSEQKRSGGPVWDAYPLQAAEIDASGTVRVRISEFEREHDYLDLIGLSRFAVPPDAEIGVDGDGRAVVYRPIVNSVSVSQWTGKARPFISPIAPDHAYLGDPGDSLDLAVTVPAGNTGRRRIGVSLVPKPAQAGVLGNRTTGITVRTSTDEAGERWMTSEALAPREHWSNAILALDPAGAVKRVRIIWNTRHTLGWIGMVEVIEPTEVTELSCISAKHSNGMDVTSSLSAADGSNAELQPGEHIDLDFRGGRDVPGTRLVLIAHGRYVTPVVPGSPPALNYLAQNRPNPFNPMTRIEFGLRDMERVSIRIFDVSGRLVRTLVEKVMTPGIHIVEWDGMDQFSRKVSSGVYFYEISAHALHDRRRMVLLR